MSNYDLGSEFGAGLEGGSKLADRIAGRRQKDEEIALEGRRVDQSQGKIDFDEDASNAKALGEYGFSVDSLNDPSSPAAGSLSSRVAGSTAADTRLKNAHAKYWESGGAHSGAAARDNLKGVVTRLNALESERQKFPDQFGPDQLAEYNGLRERHKELAGFDYEAPKAAPATPTWGETFTSGGLAGLASRITGGAGAPAAPVSAPPAPGGYDAGQIDSILARRRTGRGKAGGL